MSRLKAGYCMVPNPVSGRHSRISLLPCDISGIVFWSKNPKPMLDGFRHIRNTGIPFYVHFTLNAYDSTLEPCVAPLDERVETALQIRELFGLHALVWRYDPIVISKQTPVDWHVDLFGAVAEKLRGATDECATSFLSLYEKTKRNMAGRADWEDPDLDTKNVLLRQMQTIACSNGIALTKCCQPGLTDEVPHSVCMDRGRFAYLGATILQNKDKPNRPGCNCVDSRDIGEYDTCPHRCAYCYANTDPEMASKQFKQHQPHHESLLTACAVKAPSIDQPQLNFYG